MQILEQKYGNDGYAFWFKLLELLGDTEGHALDLNDPIACEYLQTKTRLNIYMCDEILNLLAKLKAIDQNLWENRIVWSDNFIDGVTPAYRNRKEDIPDKPTFLRKKLSDKEVLDVINPQSREEKSILEKRKEEKDIKIVKKISSKKLEIPLPDNFTISDSIRSWAKAHNFNHLEDHLEWFVDWAKANGKRKVDWDATFRNAIRGNWGKIDLSKPEIKAGRRIVCQECGRYIEKCICQQEITQ